MKTQIVCPSCKTAAGSITYPEVINTASSQRKTTFVCGKCGKKFSLATGVEYKTDMT